MVRCGIILCLLYGVVSTTEAQWQSIGTDRGSVDVYVPENPSGKQLPLAIGLHAYSNSGFILESTMQMQSVAEDRQVILCYPNGTLGFLFLRFWNATFACCGPTTGVDDSGYLRALIEQLQATFEIDPRHIHLFGYSNGGFMANRMACDHSDVVASVASFAGGSWLDPANCPAEDPVSVL
ncbi:MAG: PHB depolymerase family esterase, partial [Planctomycetota bacterium]